MDRSRKEKSEITEKLNDNKGVLELELRLRIEKQSGDEREKVETATGEVAMAKETDRKASTTEGGDGKMILEKQSGDEREKVETATGVAAMAKETDRKASSTEGGDGKIILQKGKEEETGPKATERGTQGQNEVDTNLTRTDSGQSFSIEDYLKLLTLLRINLPSGVLNQNVIQHSADPNVIKDAQAIIKDLETFQCEFIAIPRLGCREVKHALNLKKKGNIQKITRIIFFKESKESKETLKEKWEKNVSNTGHGFRIQDRYMTMPICTPTMYATAETRSWKSLEPGEDLARITAGNNKERPSPQKSGNFSLNPNDEMECLEFFNEQKEITSKYEKPTYTKGNKVEFGFLTGNLDFLVEAKHKTASHTDKIIIECKGTSGDMVGKLFTKPSDGSRQAQFIKKHKYCYQTQAYMYMLKKVTPPPTAVRAVMVVRHYHSDGSIPRDFYWNYLNEDNTQDEIEGLKIYCQEEVLARYLAVLSLIFQRESDML